MKKTITYYALFFFVMSAFGWLWEAGVYLAQHRNVGCWDVITNLRGFLHGPWVPIYGVGCVLIALAGHGMQKKPVQLFFRIVALCGALEYTTSLALELLFHARWWDYSTYPFNLNGRVYLLGLLAFGGLGLLVFYVVEPLFGKLVKRFSPQMQTVAVNALSVLFLLDVLQSVHMPNLGLGVTVIGGV